MNSLKNLGYLFWTFIYLIVLLQLSINNDFKFTGALLFTLAIVLITLIHERFVRKKIIKTYIDNKKATQFVASYLVLSGIASLLLTIIGHFVFKEFLLETTNDELINHTKSLFFGFILLTSLISIASYALELFKQKIASERKQQELKNSVLELEIDHLRTQLSPHFTFNILNNLQFLIRKDKDEALELLSRYSKILRYYVYESQNKWIKLDDELTFLRYYFQLEKDRSGENVQINFQMDTIPESNLMIIPFLLSTFIENAFKHVSVKKTENYIHLNISLKDNNELNLHISNSCDENPSSHKKSGVGLAQAKKRLELSYPYDYDLKLNRQHNEYTVSLKLKLTT